MGLMRQTKLGVTSLLCGVISLLMLSGVYPLMAWLDRSGTKIPEPWQTLGVIYMPLAVLLTLMAIGFGIVGLFRKQRKRGIAIIGLCIGLASIVLFVAMASFIFMSNS